MHRSTSIKGSGRSGSVRAPIAIVMIVSLVALLPGLALADGFDYYTSMDMETSMGSVIGPGAAGSSFDVTPGYQGEISVSGNKRDDSGSQLIGLGVRLGNDLGMGSRSVSLTNLRWEKTAEDHKLKLGDVMEFFSQYSLSSSFKGFSYTTALEGDGEFDLTAVGGYAYPRWENVYAGREVVSVQREVKGVRFGTAVDSTLDRSYGVSIVSSLDRNGINPGDKLYDNLVLSLDCEFSPIPGLNVRAVGALSDTTETSGSTATKVSGSAYKIEATSAARQGRAVFEYERATPGFMAVMGSVKADREKIKLRITSNHSKTLTSTIAYLYLRDNLEEQKPDTTISNKPEVSVSLRRLLNRRYASLTAAVKLDNKRVSSGKEVIGRSISVDYGDRFGPVDTSISISGDFSESAGGSSPSKAETMTYAVEFSGRTEMGAATMRPVLISNLTASLDCLSGDRSLQTDTAVELRIDLPASNVNSSVRIGQQKPLEASSSSPQKSYADLSVYYRPRFLSSLKNGRIYLRANHVDYRYADATKDRAETGVRTGVSLSW